MMARLRTTAAIAATTPEGVPVELMDPMHPVWSIPRTADAWRAVHNLLPAGPLGMTYKPPATGCRLRHAQALTDWCNGQGIDPKEAPALTGYTARVTASERAAARQGTDYLQCKPPNGRRT